MSSAFGYFLGRRSRRRTEPAVPGCDARGTARLTSGTSVARRRGLVARWPLPGCRRPTPCAPRDAHRNAAEPAPQPGAFSVQLRSAPAHAPSRPPTAYHGIGWPGGGAGWVRPNEERARSNRRPPATGPNHRSARASAQRSPGFGLAPFDTGIGSVPEGDIQHGSFHWTGPTLVAPKREASSVRYPTLAAGPRWCRGGKPGAGIRAPFCTAFGMDLGLAMGGRCGRRGGGDGGALEDKNAVTYRAGGAIGGGLSRYWFGWRASAKAQARAA